MPTIRLDQSNTRLLFGRHTQGIFVTDEPVTVAERHGTRSERKPIFAIGDIVQVNMRTALPNGTLVGLITAIYWPTRQGQSFVYEINIYGTPWLAHEADLAPAASLQL